MTSAKDRVLARINVTADKTASARERKQSKGSATGYVSIWNDAVMDGYGKDHCIAPTMKVSGMLLRAIKRLPNQNPAHVKLFISWVVEEWPRLAGPNKKWNEVPDLGSFVYGIPRLYSDYCRKDQSKVRLAGSKKSTAVDTKKLSTLEADNKALRLLIEQQTKEIATLKSRVEMLTGKGK